LISNKSIVSIKIKSFYNLGRAFQTNIVLLNNIFTICCYLFMYWQSLL
jgi:hypothetical protein